MSSLAPHASPPSRQRPLSGGNLYRAILNDEKPEALLESIPAQAVYCALRSQGVASAAELIEVLPRDKLAACLDFDLWRQDRLQEESLFEWLELPDVTADLDILRKILGAIDLRLISILIGQYVHTVVYDQPNEVAPGDGFITPDNGFTWVHVDAPGGNREFLLSRLLALIFDTSAELFYQLISIPGVATNSGLEEEAFQDREKRLHGLGVPDREFAAKLHTPQPARFIAQKEKRLTEVSDLPVVSPLTSIALAAGTDGSSAPFLHLTESEEEYLNLQAEIALLVNAALVHFGQDWREPEHVTRCAGFVGGTIRLGLDSFLRLETNVRDVFIEYGMQRFYSAGLAEILPLRRQAVRILPESLERHKAVPRLLAIVALLRSPICVVPDWFSPETHTSVAVIAEDNQPVLSDYEAHYRFIESAKDVQCLKAILDEL
jgi:hypothetical protein